MLEGCAAFATLQTAQDWAMHHVWMLRIESLAILFHVGPSSAWCRREVQGSCGLKRQLERIRNATFSGRHVLRHLDVRASKKIRIVG
eukprot:5551056-Amphidinium_carterae.1